VASAPVELVDQPGALAVGGDSAGGMLAALACLRPARPASGGAARPPGAAVREHRPHRGQPSMREKATGFGLDADTVRWVARQWVPDERRWSDPRVSPLHAPDVSGLPAAVIVSGDLWLGPTSDAVHLGGVGDPRARSRAA